MRLVSSLLVSGLVAVAAGAIEVAAGESTKGQRDFAQAGWPAMSLLIGVAFLVASVLLGIKHGHDDIKGSNSVLSGSFVIINAANAVIGIFLTFGPNLGPLVGILGYQMMVCAAIGFYGYYTNLRAVAKALFVLITVTIFSLVGCFPLLSHTMPTFSLTQSQCYGYFIVTSADYNRCQDDGFLQLLRTFSLFGLALLSIQLAQLFLAFTDGTQLTPKGATSPNSLLSGYQSQQYVAPSVYEVPAAQQQQQQQQAAATAPAPVSVVPQETGGLSYQSL